MRVYNKSKKIYQESRIDSDGNVKFINLLPSCSLEVDDKIAEKWLKTGDVVEFVEPKAAKEEEDRLKAEIEKLKAENAKLKEVKATPKVAAKSRKK